MSRRLLPIAALAAAAVLALPAPAPRAETRSRAHGGAFDGRAADAQRLVGLLRAGWRHGSDRLHYQLRVLVPEPVLDHLWRATGVLATLASPTFDPTALTSSAPAALTAQPVLGELSSPFGMRRDPIRGRRSHHRGIDFVAERHTPVRAAGPGVVTRAGWVRGYGRAVYIDHGGGVETRYAHLQRLRVRAGEFVPRGAAIGSVGSSGRATGPHLHFEVRVDGAPVDPTSIVDAPLPGRTARRRRGRS